MADSLQKGGGENPGVHVVHVEPFQVAHGIVKICANFLLELTIMPNA